MAKIGVSVKIDVSKIDKSRMFKGEKGTYLDAVVFIDMDNKDQYGNSGVITQDWKDAPKGQTPILGNVKVFWSDAGQQKPASQPQQQKTATTKSKRNSWA
jgi:hypothetical protein